MRALFLLILTLACQLALAWTAPDHQSLATAQQARDTDREMQQRDRLAAAQRRLATVRSRVSSDDTRFRSLQRELEELQATRLRRLDSLVMQRRAVHDLYTTSRQTAGDLITILRNTTTGPPADNLEQELAKLAASKRALDLNALAGLWEAMHLTLTDTATGSRRVVPVQIAPGELAQEEVTRIGTVLAVAGDRAVVYDRIAGVYRALPPGDREHRRLTLALSKNQSGISTAPFVPGPIKHVGRDAVAESVRGSGPIGVLIVVLGGIGIVVLTVRALLIYRMLRSEKLTGSDSAGGRLRAQRDSHQSERSESLAGWLNALVRREARKAQWGHTVLSVIIGVAPLLGLLGTVTGMIVTFHALRLYGGGDPILMADGIAQALSTTLLGLTVAIPLLIGQRWLLTWANRHVRRLDAQAVALLSESRGAT